MLRGISTITGSVTPLVLVDGVEGSLTTVAPENIASIDVLKMRRQQLFMVRAVQMA